MDTIHLRLDVRIEKEMHDFLQEEASLKKMSFEGLILLYIRERMEQQRRNVTGGGG
jgi:predicted HicB family RNase H-like nuclease